MRGLTPHLTNELACVIPARDEPVRDLPKRVALDEPCELVRDPRAKPRRKGLSVGEAAVLEVVRANPGITIRDVNRLMGRPGTGEAAGRMLVLLEAAGKVRSHHLTCKRDIERAGGRLLWEAT